MMMSGDMGGPGVMANPWAPGNNPVPSAGRRTTQKALIKAGYARASGYAGSIPSMARPPGGRNRPGRSR
ncbi:MAG TPA: hypothetical protein VGJ60_07775 [Chloroflexota bacterium]|jgi:hypothetical protein